jgi:hypothetical protein
VDSVSPNPKKLKKKTLSGKAQSRSEAEGRRKICKGRENMKQQRKQLGGIKTGKLRRKNSDEKE